MAEVWARANRDGERIGRAVAWVFSGGLGWKIARWALDPCRGCRPGLCACRPAIEPACPASLLLWHHLDARPGYAQVLDVLAARNPACCEVCGQPRGLCPRRRYLDAGLPSPVGCSGQRW